MPTDRLYKLESSTREEVWVPDPVITNPISGGGNGGIGGIIITPPQGTVYWGGELSPSWGSSSAGFAPPNPTGGGSGGGGSGGDGPDYIYLSDLLEDLANNNAPSANLGSTVIINDIPPSE